jgi:mRNA deadenylase 3'-5' endonuclease subunit Ccr4
MSGFFKTSIHLPIFVFVFDWAKSKHASIVCFQEMHSNNNIEKYWEDEWGNKCVFSHHDSKSAGVCTHINIRCRVFLRPVFIYQSLFLTAWHIYFFKR